MGGLVGLAEDICVSEPQHGLAVHLIGETEAWGEVIEVPIVLVPAVGAYSDELQPARDPHAEGRCGIGIEVVRAVKAFGARRVEIVAETEIERELSRDAPIVLQVPGGVHVLRGNILEILNEVVAARSGAKHERCETVSGGGAGRVGVGALGHAGGKSEDALVVELSDTDAMEAAFKAELKRVAAMNFGEVGQSCVAVKGVAAMAVAAQ